MRNHHRNVKKFLFTSLAVLLSVPVGLLSQDVAHANALSSQRVNELLAPHKSSYGYYIDQYLLNRKDNTTPATNPSTALFTNTFGQLWSGDGTKKNPKILQENLDKSAAISQHVTKTEELRSFLTDREDSPYDLIRGLGPYANSFIQKANAKTQYTSLPTHELPADTKDDPSAGLIWADDKSQLGPMVNLVDTMALYYYSSSGNAKQYYKYVRPFRQDSQVKVNPYLKAAFDATPQNDYDFPSGHTTQAFESGLAMAYAFPERFQQLVTRSSEVGYDRILVGRHSPLAVMGGRVLGTAVAAAVLNNSQNKEIAQKAYGNAQKVLAKSKLTQGKDDYQNYQENLKNYTLRMTYGFKPLSSTKVPMRVPKGAEVLLKTRFPYLNATQRREVLYTTGFTAGYPLTQDPEGWGRLNLFKAANGFGRLLTNTTVNMDAHKGLFNARDTWRNNLSGDGTLIKKGTGSLKLLGANHFKGGVVIKGGTLIAGKQNALGSGNVKISRGTLNLSSRKVTVKGHYAQTSKGTLQLSSNNRLAVQRNGRFAGKLVVSLNSRPAKKLVIIKVHKRLGKFKQVKINGKYGHYHVKYTQKTVELVH
ncbi:phosphatase PAP2 family protein [Lentilactobacillus raoultii]|uniref:Phosphatase PAP2 family protein n=1 Tax=Lentilactobacillus raoultii TaxID=1987503 RepID=A0ABW3PGG9_9LACO|nr:phosphatase PAP2 family protein [Lentilactobacillus raoultii]